MKIYDYKSYEEYVEAQVEGNRRKIKNSYVDPVSLTYVMEQLHTRYSLAPKQVLCHGTRRGLEQAYIKDAFAKHNIESSVLGTEISPTATDYPYTIQWDFHQTKPEWIGSIDLIYSNSFDHSYKPIECLDTWMSCLSEDGLCVIEYSGDCDTKSGKIDPFAASLEDYEDFITKKYVIVDVITNEGMQDKGETHRGLRHYIIISK